MRKIVTVTGEITTDQLGFAQMHEHLYVSEGPMTRINPALLIDNAKQSEEELIAYRNAGGVSVLDAQPGGAGRDTRILRTISERSGVHIITVTGFHLPQFYPAGHWTNTWDEEQLYCSFVEELLHGTTETHGVKAGAVKAAVGADGLSYRTSVKLRAAARAAVQANVPMVMHTEKGLAATAALRLCDEAGLSSRYVIVCHVDRDAKNIPLHEEIAKTGAMLEYDTIGRSKYHDNSSECNLIAHMIEKGYEKQLLLSLDTTAQRLTSYGGTIGLTYLICEFLPLLKRFGVSSELIRTITTENPKRVFL